MDEKKKGGKHVTLAGLVVLAALGAGGHFLTTRGLESTDDAQIESHIAVLASRVPGYAAEVLVDNNQSVKAGDVLVRIDPTDYKIALDRARATLKSAQGQLATATHDYSSTTVTTSSNVAAAEMKITAAKAQLDRDVAELNRLKKMGDAARSRSQLDAAIATEKTARTEYTRAQEALKSAKTAPDTLAAVGGRVQSMEGAEGQAKAEVAQAEKNLADTEIKAPFDGTIAGKATEKGAYISPGQQLVLLVSTEDWVVANFKETQLEKMKPGQKADIRVDAYPGKILKGHVDSVQHGTGARFSLFPPENATGNFVKVVQRVPVKIVFDEKPDPALHLGPGMSVVPTVDTR